MKKLLLAGVLAVGALGATDVALRAQTNVQFPTTGWSGYAPGRIECGVLRGVDLNKTTDTAIPISVPTLTYMIDAIDVTSPSTSLTTAVGGVYSAASKGGVAIVANSQVFSALTSSTANTTGNALSLTLSTAGNTTEFGGPAATSPITTIYLSLTTAQGAAATANVRVYCRPHYG